ncbi:MAG: FkbM family methyltransferase [Comamonas sp.]
MSITSYAQNFEDVMLWRALKNIENGFYIDIGAQDPVVDSVSMAFYEQGWRGVHVEPTQQYSAKLRNARLDEIVEQVAIGDSQGNLTFYEFTDTGLSTADPVIAKKHQDAGFSVVKSEVLVVSLDFIFNKYGGKDINWLKIDVEGLERNVLDSWRTSFVRPWILVIESTKPLTQIENYIEWEILVLKKGYDFAYFDGLNRFYVHQDHQELLSFFKVPPNIFDGFTLSGVASQPFCHLIIKKSEEIEERAQLKQQEVEARAQQAVLRLQGAEARAQQAAIRQKEAEMRAQQAALRQQEAEARGNQADIESREALRQLHAVYSSASWRITSPLRTILRFFQRITHQ